jgi:hypothetical protein
LKSVQVFAHRISQFTSSKGKIKASSVNNNKKLPHLLRILIFRLVA